jgi:GTP-binding protein YchF
MALQAGIVGLPNVGKSTLFNALTAGSADAANYPFATIEPNVGVVPVPDDRLGRIASVIETKSIVPAVVEIVDIAGLVRGASEGEGLGNQFLGHIRSVDAILHVVRCFESTDVTHVEGTVDPRRDIETVELELVLADLSVAERRLDRQARSVRTGDKAAVFDRDVTARLVAALSAGTPARAVAWTDDERRSLSDAQFITMKPVLYVCNVDEDGLAGSPHVDVVREIAAGQDAGIVTICAEVEAEIARLEPADREVFLADLGLSEPGLSSLAREAYRLLGLETFFTAGPKEIRAWTVPVGTKAARAAGTIHTDFERGFIRAEVYRIDDLLTHGSEAALRAAGKIRAEGRDYLVQDGDVILFRFNV